MTFELTARQEEARDLLAGDQRHTCLVGGARSGKTFLFVRQVLIRAIKASSSRHAILRYRFNAVRASIWLDTLPKVMKLCWPDLKWKPNRQDGYIELGNYSEVWLGGLDERERVEKILGLEYATIFFNECSQIPYSSVVVARTRLAQNIDGLALRAFYDLNPTGRGHWTNLLFGEHLDPYTRRPLAEPEQFQRMFMNPRDNAANLPEGYIDSELEGLPDKQRKRFLLGVYVDEVDNALWTMETIEQGRCEPSEVPELVRVVVAVDPSGTSGAEEKRSDAVGIAAAGLGVDGLVYVLEDATCRLPPAGWGHRVVEVYERHQADRVVAEANFGGAMVAFVIETADPRIKVHMVTASRGKSVRAEPVSALYEKGRVRHAGRFPDLEDEMLSFSTAGYQGERSPNRADALVWAVTELAVGLGKPVFGTPEADIFVPPFPISQHWPRLAVIFADHARFVAVWAALDRQNDVLYLTEEYATPLLQLPIHAEAVRARGAWIPSLIDLEDRGRSKPDGAALAQRLDALGCLLFPAPLDFEAGLREVVARLNSGRLRVFNSLQQWKAQYRMLRRDNDGDVVEEGDDLMRATALMMGPGLGIAITEARQRSDGEGRETMPSELVGLDRHNIPSTGY